MKWIIRLFSVFACFFFFQYELVLAEPHQPLIKRVDECIKTELYRNLNSRDVVIFVEEFDLKTGLIVKQHLLKGKGKVPKFITDLMPFMDRRHFKNNQYIYAYDLEAPQRASGGSTLLMVHENKVESMQNTILIEALIKSFKRNLGK